MHPPTHPWRRALDMDYRPYTSVTLCAWTQSISKALRQEWVGAGRAKPSRPEVFRGIQKETPDAFDRGRGG